MDTDNNEVLLNKYDTSIRPELDGHTHINIYTKAQTTLGKWLSNFYDMGIVHPSHGTFKCIEGYWQWLSTGMTHDVFKVLNGYDAKKLSKTLPKVKMEGFEELICNALELKIRSNPELFIAFKESILDFTHYYVYGHGLDVKIVNTKYEWMIEFLTNLRDRINKRNLRVCIAGSRDIKDEDILDTCMRLSDLSVGEVVSGTARGVDVMGENWAIENDLPIKSFPADWERLGKSAGYIRNTEMGEYIDAAIIIWDGVSKGTKSMLDICLKKPLPVFLALVEKDSKVRYFKYYRPNFHPSKERSEVFDA